MAKNYPTLGNSAIATPTIVPTVGDASSIFSARVVDVNLEPSSNPLSLFQITNGWGSIGAIRFESLDKNTNTNNQITTQASIAYPMDINFKKIPTLGETVFIIQGPSYKQLTTGNSDASQFYYLNAISVWNKNHLNMIPPSSESSTNTNTVDNASVSEGIPNNPETQVEEPSPGKTFKEESYIRNLYPVEGDIILEGRWGNSLRFSSTAIHTSESKDTESPWSSEGRDGSPITILRNGQGSDSSFNNWFPIYEDIQNDASSIYLTDGQLVKVLLGSTNFDSFGVEAVPTINTTALMQEVPVENPNISNKDLDDTDIKYDSVNQEPDLSTDIKTRIEDKDSGSPLAGIFNSETNVKEQVKENEQMVNNNVDGGRTRQEQNRRLSRKNINDQ
tara:strand:+ start:2794 stop:3963 length:1170 start_codon:yes stop_codon:yes gene_type:complete